jgi:hypothetical protein
MGDVFEKKLRVGEEAGGLSHTGFLRMKPEAVSKLG